MKTKERVNQWKKTPFDQPTIDAVIALENHPDKLEDAFYKNTEFGTGGMRGIMGVGTNRINKYTLGRATQGVANYLRKTVADPHQKVVIAYDCRNNSHTFAKVVAQIFSANGIESYLFSSLRPTPVLSFTVRKLKAHCGIVLTASHNPPQYNGYKVYNAVGGQIVPPEDAAIIGEIEEVAFADIQWNANSKLIHSIDQSIDKAYTDRLIKESLGAPHERENLKIVFTPLHGTSVVSLPPVLKKAGYQHLYVVEEQATPDGNFPTVSSPNPEEREAFALALHYAKREDAAIVLGTDPDADRLGVGIKNLQGDWELLNGNQLMIVLTRFVLEQKQISENAFIASTIVSTPLMPVLAKVYGVECKVGLTGFKWIGKMIEDFPEQQFLCGGEESYGFLFGDEVRDKDAISAALLACDLQAHLAAQGKSIYEYLIDTYHRFGCYHEELVAVTKEGKKGAEEISKMMANFRKNPPKNIAGTPVEIMEDYQASIRYVKDGRTETIPLPQSNVLRFILEDGACISIRPSGTEPKIKYYFSVTTTLQSADAYCSTIEELKQQCQTYRKAFTQ